MNKESVNPIARRNADWLQGRSSVAHGDPVLIADDSDSDTFFLLRAFHASGVTNPIFAVRSGQKALDYLQGKGEYSNRQAYPLPRIVFLDLRMPPPDGFEILRWKEQHPELSRILFIAMSNFTGVAAINAAYSAGAATFLSKPLNAKDISNLIEGYRHYWTTDSPVVEEDASI